MPWSEGATQRAGAPPDAPVPPTSARCRIVHVNDVYTLETFPALARLVDKTKPDAVTLSGDFLAPYLLSSLDRGRGMVAVMNAAGVTHVCFGNHEADVPYDALLKRIGDYNGTWINTNMRAFEVPLPEVGTVVVRSADGSQTRKVGILGLLGHDLDYRGHEFNGAVSSCTPINSTAAAVGPKLVADGAVDAVVPMTHQDTPDDRELAKMGLFPVILGGHDHEAYYEQHGPSFMLKVGMNAETAAIVDLVWPAGAPKGAAPEVSVCTVKLEDHCGVPGHEDDDVRALVTKQNDKVEALQSAVIFSQPSTSPLLSSKGSRLHECTMATLLATCLRRGLGADMCLLGGGAVRADTTYPSNSLTIGDIAAELPRSLSGAVVVSLPGRVISAAVAASRAATNGGTAPCSSFFHVDDGVTVNSETLAVTAIGGAPLEGDKVYTVACVRWFLCGCGIAPLDEWTAGMRERGEVPGEDAEAPCQDVVTKVLAQELWKGLPPFASLDVNGDGFLSEDEVRAAYASIFPLDANGDGVISPVEKAAADLAVDALLRSRDRDGDGRISRAEYEAHW